MILILALETRQAGYIAQTKRYNRREWRSVLNIMCLQGVGRGTKIVVSSDAWKRGDYLEIMEQAEQRNFIIEHWRHEHEKT